MALSIRRRAAWALLAALLATTIWASCEREHAASASARADSLAAEAAAERARADGWVAVFGEATASLLEQLAAADSQAARLSRELEAAWVRPVARTAVVATATGEVEARARPAGMDSVDYVAGDATIAPADVAPPPVVADIQDGPLRARVAFFPIDTLFQLRWSVHAPGELIHSLTGDGRLVVFARSSDPRVQWEVSALEYELPEPEARGFPWKWILGAAIAGAVGWEAIR